MKIGVFDSGLGGLFILSKIIEKLPNYDYQYLGDTLRVPYGDRSDEEIFEFTKNAVEYLLKDGCGLVVVACNTATAVGLEKIKENMLQDYQDRKIIGIVGSTTRSVLDAGTVAILATKATIKSNIFENKIKKHKPSINVVSIATPTFVPLIESGDTTSLEIEIQRYLEITKMFKVDKLILGCTHYPIVSDLFRKYLPAHTELVSQADIFPTRLLDFIEENELANRLSLGSTLTVRVTKITNEVNKKVLCWFPELDSQVQEIFF